MTVIEFITLLNLLPPNDDITIPFPFPGVDLVEHEPFILEAPDGILILPKPIAELYLNENPDDIIL